MSQAYIIECGDCAAGIITREKRGFLFHAAADAFRPLEGRTFESPQEAQRAAENLRRNKKLAKYTGRKGAEPYVEGRRS